MSKVNLNDVTTFQNDTTAVNTVNTNSATIETAFDNTLSRDGTAPNQMLSNLDMNSFRVLNLSVPINGSEPLRLQDAATLNGGGTIASGLTSVGLTMPADYTVTGSPLTSNGSITVAFANAPTGTGAHVRQVSPTITTPTITAPVISTITNTGTITLPTSTDTLIGKATTDTLTNKTINTAGTGNHIQISGVDIIRGQLLGTGTNDTATAGNIGEFVSNSATTVAITTGIQTNLTSISLTAGDWDVWGWFQFVPTGTPTLTSFSGSVSSTSAVLDTLQTQMNVNIAGNQVQMPTPMKRFSLSTTTTIFLVGQFAWTGGTPTANGQIFARRAR